MSIALKAGFSAAEARDALGRWSGGGGGGAIGKAEFGHPVLVDPTPHAVSHLFDVSGMTVLHVLSIGKNIVVGGLLTLALAQVIKERHRLREAVDRLSVGHSLAHLTIKAGPDEPIPLGDKHVGVYRRGQRLAVAAIPGPIKGILGMQHGPRVAAPQRMLGTKSGFDASEPRDKEGQWTDGGGGARDERLAWPERVKGVDADGNLHTVHVNPRPAQAASLGQHNDTLNALALGHNVAVGTATHDDIFDALKKAAHHLVSTYQQRAEAKKPHNRLVLEKVGRPSVADRLLGSHRPLPEWQAKYGGYLNQGLVDEKHWPRALKVAYGTAAGLAVPGIFRVRTPPLRLSLVPHLRLPSPVIRLSKPMNPDLKFNFQPSQPRDPVGRWTHGGGGFDPAYQTFSRLGRRIGNRFGEQPLTPGHLPHPDGDVWVNPSSARLVKLFRDTGSIGSIARSGKNLVVARGLPIDQAIQHVANNRHNIVATAEPDAPYAMAQTVIKESPTWLSRKRVLFINPSPRNLANLVRTSRDGRVRTLVIGDNLVVGKNAPNHSDMARILQHSGHPLGSRFWGASHPVVMPRPSTNSVDVSAETKAGFSASQTRDEHGRWAGGGGGGSGGRFQGRGSVLSGRMPRVRDTLRTGMIDHPHGTILVNPHPAVLAVMLHAHDRTTSKPPTVMAVGRNLIVGDRDVTRADLRHADLTAVRPSFSVLHQWQHHFDDLPQARESEQPAGYSRSPEWDARQGDRHLPQTLIQHPKGSIIVNPHPADIADMIHGTGGHIHLIRAGGNVVVAGSNIPRNEVLDAVAKHGTHYDFHIAKLAQKRANDPVDVEIKAGFSSFLREKKSMTTEAAALAELKQLLGQIPNVTSAPCELKFIGDPDEGLIEGYASIYGNTDGHGDVVESGAFDTSLKDWLDSGKPIPMYGEHSPYKQGGDPYPVGKWESVESDETGLRVKGRLLALDHPDVKRVHTLIKSGVMPGISIAYNVNPGGAEYGRKAGEPKRKLKSINLVSIDLTANPSNPLALIDGVKAVSAMQAMADNSVGPDVDGDLGDPDQAVGHLEGAMGACNEMLDADQPPDVEDLMGLMERLHDCHDALTGNAPQIGHMDVRDAADLPDGDGVKSITFTKRRLERRLREEPIAGKRLSQREARDFVDRFFDDEPRDEAEAPESKATDATVTELAAALADFTLIPRS